MDTKPTNPKDLLAVSRAPLHLIPGPALLLESLAFGEGAFKYGPYNWREKGVSVSTYHAAVGRHLLRFYNGEWADPKTGVPHLGSARAGLGIIIDAWATGNLNDDRPRAMTTAQLDTLFDGAVTSMDHLRNLFGGRNAETP